MEAVQGDGAAAAGEADAVGDLGDGADLRVPVVVLGDEQDAVLVADVDGQSHVHVREDHEVFQGDEQKADRVLVLVLAHGSRFRTDAVVASETVPTKSRAPPERASALRTAEAREGDGRNPPRETIRRGRLRTAATS